MIKTLSPFYKTIPWEYLDTGTFVEKYVLNIYIWDGLKASVPITPTIQQENVNPLGREDSTNVDISRFINGYLSEDLITNTTTSLNNSNTSVWVKTEVIYYIDNVAQSVELEEIDLAVKGYGYGIEGSNTSTPTNNYLATTVEQKVYNKGVYLCSFLASETETTTISIESENKTVSLSKLATTNSNDLVQLLYINVSEFDGDYIEIYKNDILINTLLITNELKFEPLDIAFINKEGQLQTITFFKEKITTLKTDSKEYESSNGQPIDGIHQFKTYNVNGRESFSVNSGFIKEDNNEVFTQMLLSTKLWQLKDGIYIPLNKGTDSIEYQSRNKERLLNYKIDFKYSFNKINNI